MAERGRRWRSWSGGAALLIGCLAPTVLLWTRRLLAAMVGAL